MNYKELYESKLTTASEAIKSINAGDKVFMGFACAEPFHIIRTMVNEYESFSNVEIINMITFGDSPWCRPEMKGHFHLNTLFASASNRKALADGYSDFTPVNFSDIPKVLKEYIKPRVAIVTVSPPDEHGYVSFGTNVDCTKPAADCAEIVIGQVNRFMPRTLGDSVKHIREFTHLVECDEQLPESPTIPITDTEMKIGQYCASLINDGDCLQLGIGGIPNAVCAQLKDKKDLGIHSEMIGDGVVDLIESGVINNSRKQYLKNFTLIGFAYGTKKLNDFINNNPSVLMMPINHVNDPDVIALNDNMVSINSCLQVDLLGQVVADSVGLAQFSAVGGQVDFVRGAQMSNGGRSIIAMPSTAKKGQLSRIVPIVTEGSAITTTRNDVNYVVTEYGIAQLKGKSLRERAKALISISHPKFRPIFIAEYVNRFHEEPFTKEELKSLLVDDAVEDVKSAIENVVSTVEKDIKKIFNKE